MKRAMSDNTSASSNSDINFGCSPFFLTSSGISLISAWDNRAQSIRNAYEDEYFRSELERQKERYEDIKEAEEWAFKKWLRRYRRKNAREQTEYKLQSELSKKELKQFFDEWPLKVSVESARLALSSQKAGENLAVILGKPGGSVLSIEYENLVLDIRDTLEKYATKRDYVFSFAENNKICGGAALASIFSCLCSFPTVMIHPFVSKDAVHFSICLWTTDSVYPRQTHALSIPWDENRARNEKAYLQEKEKRFCLTAASLICVVNDAYRALEFFEAPLFPAMVRDYRIADQTILAFAKKEYLSVTQEIRVEYRGKELNVSDFLLGADEQVKLKGLVDKALDELFD